MEMTLIISCGLAIILVNIICMFFDYIPSKKDYTIVRQTEEMIRKFETEQNLNRVLKNQDAILHKLEQQILERSMRNNDEDLGMVKQVVYKVDGDFNGNINGDNVTVVLMGDGDFNGNIESNDGNVVLIKGNVNGDIKANKVLMPNKKRDIYTGRRGIVVRCPMCNELYTQSLSINGSTSEDGTNLMLDVKIDVEEPFRCKCESCRYY